MNRDALKHFLVLADCLNFRRASRVCHLSPSAFSRSIQRLEEEVGGSLFYRDNRSVVLSEAGKIFQQYAQSALNGWEDIRAEIHRLTGGDDVSGKLRLYASVTAVYSLLPELLERYRASYPKVQLDLSTGVAEEAMQLVLDQAVDVAVAALPDENERGKSTAAQNLKFLPLIKTDLVFISAKGYGDWPRKRGLLDLAETPLILPRGGLARQRANHWFQQNQVRPNIAAEVSGNEGILSMVRLGSGVGLVPELVMERSPFRNEVLRLVDVPKLDPYTVGLCTSEKNLTRPAVSALWQEGAKGQEHS